MRRVARQHDLDRCSLDHRRVCRPCRRRRPHPAPHDRRWWRRRRRRRTLLDDANAATRLPGDLLRASRGRRGGCVRRRHPPRTERSTQRRLARASACSRRREPVNGAPRGTDHIGQGVAEHASRLGRPNCLRADQRAARGSPRRSRPTAASVLALSFRPRRPLHSQWYGSRGRNRGLRASQGSPRDTARAGLRATGLRSVRGV
jgi:hypothetical protein